MSSPASLADRRFPRILACLLALGALSQALILSQALEQNPFARHPTSDPLVYWELAGRIARGELLQDTPFLSAPLYPYLLGFLRALGFGLAGVFGVQAAMHIATAGLLARIGRKRFGALEGLIAAGLFLALFEPAFTAGRLLNGSLQLFLIALFWDRLLALEEEHTKRLALVTGSLLGLVCLASPPMLIAVPFVMLLAWRSAGVSRAALVVLATGAAIFPATAHNYIVSGELIPISAQAGITYHHGNQSNSVGIYTPAEGVSADRMQQNADAIAVARTALGSAATWSDASALYRTRSIRWQWDNKLAATELFARKLWLFLTARVYGDVYLPSLERSDGMASRLWLAPVRLAWILPLAIVVLILRMRKDRWQSAHEALILGVPLLVVCFFWYSPRYRLPATPAIVLLAAYGLAQLMGNHKRAWLAVALAAGVLSLFTRTEIDQAKTWRAPFHAAAGNAYMALGEEESAEFQFQLAAIEGDEIARFRLAFAELKAKDNASRNDIQRAADEWSSAYAQRTLATLAAEQGDPAQAIQLFHRALVLDSTDYRSETGLGNALVSSEQAAEALTHHERAVELHPEGALQHFGLGVTLLTLGRLVEAEAALRAALDREDLPAARTTLMSIAWELATHGLKERRNGERALSLAREFGSSDDPGALDILAAAQAETGDFPSALVLIDEAITLLHGAGESKWAGELEARRAEYLLGKAWRQ